MRSRIFGSRAPKGSSMSRMRGPTINVAAIATRCCMPPESSFGYFASQPSSPTLCTHSPARTRRSARGTARSARPKAMLSTTVRCGSSE